jgi:hypothetical protein
MVQIPEHSYYSFSYKHGGPVPFAKVAVYAVFNGQRTAVLSVGPFSTSGNGLLPKITRDPSWVAPDLMFWDVAAKKYQSFPLYAWDYQVDWDRPAPFAEFDNQSFDDVTNFLKYLCVRYGFLANLQPTPLTFKLSRVGSPAPEPQAIGMFFQLRTLAEQMPSKSDGDQIAILRNILVSLSTRVPIATSTFGKQTKERQAGEFLQVLRRLAQDRTGLSVTKILTEVQQSLPGRRETIYLLSEEEDWAMTGLLIFLAGLMVYGYNFSTLDETSDSAGMIREIIVSMVKP